MSEESDRAHGLTREEKVSLLIALPLAGGLSAVTGKPDGICLSVTPIAELTVAVCLAGIPTRRKGSILGDLGQDLQLQRDRLQNLFRR
jgi:hypothetical protein